MMILIQRVILISIILTTQVLAGTSTGLCACNIHTMSTALYCEANLVSSSCQCGYDDTCTESREDYADSYCLHTSCHTLPVQTYNITGTPLQGERHISFNNVATTSMYGQETVLVHTTTPYRPLYTDYSPILTFISTSVLIV